jgi:hypothetical protein
LRFSSKAKGVRPHAISFTVIVRSWVKNWESDIVSAQHLARQ